MGILFAFGSAFFSGITAILAKCGIAKTDSTVATAIRTVVVLLFAWLMVFIVGSEGTITSLSAHTWIFLILSGLATGARSSTNTGISSSNSSSSSMWLVYALLSAVFAALTAILGKIGIDEVESNLGTAIRTVVVLIMAWFMVAVSHKGHLVRTVPKKELLFI